MASSSDPPWSPGDGGDDRPFGAGGPAFSARGRRDPEGFTPLQDRPAVEETLEDAPEPPRNSRTGSANLRGTLNREEREESQSRQTPVGPQNISVSFEKQPRLNLGKIPDKTWQYPGFRAEIEGKILASKQS